MHDEHRAPPVVALREIVIRDIRVAADIGVYAHEVGRRQALIVDVRMCVRDIAGDRITDTVDYNWVVQNALQLGETHVALIETFAFNLATLCLADDRVDSVEVIVAKPGALANGSASTRIILKSA